MAAICGGVGVEMPVSWSSPFSGGDSNAKVSGVIDDTDGFLPDSRVSKINFLGDQKYGYSIRYFFSVIFFKKSL